MDSGKWRWGGVMRFPKSKVDVGGGLRECYENDKETHFFPYRRAPADMLLGPPVARPICSRPVKPKENYTFWEVGVRQPGVPYPNFSNIYPEPYKKVVKR